MTKRTIKKVIDKEGSLTMGGKVIIRKLPKEKLCYIHPDAPKPCPGQCKGATTYWRYASCGYGLVQQRLIDRKKEGNHE